MLKQHKTPSFVRKYGPVISQDKVPYPSVLTFNAGISRWNGGYIMLFRNDYNFCKKDYDDFYAGIADNTMPKINIGMALSKDGVNWNVTDKPVAGLQFPGISYVYDPRITVMDDGEAILCFAASSNGTRGGIASTRDFEHFEIKSISVPDNRNMVVFPEKIHGEYVRLERPFYCNDRNHSLWLSYSPDLVYWGKSELVLKSRDVPFSNLKIGPGAPPVKTDKGWLVLFHGVETQDENFDAWQRDWTRCYYGGAMLLDLEKPSRIIAMAGKPLLVPEEKYELEGYRGGVIFPGGLVAEPDGMAKIYYGAADTVECLAEAKISDIIDFCFENNSMQS